MGTTTRVYSYSRFSRIEQRKGDSTRRQSDMARDWAKQHGYEFDEQMLDEGLSGYLGTNKKRGALGRFIERVEKGDVPRGSILVVEAIDRLSREPFLDAMDTITRLVRAGITIVTLEPRQTIDVDRLNSSEVYMLVAMMQLAWGESNRKSQRIRASRDQARKNARELGKVMTGMCPAWLKPCDSRIGFTVIAEAAHAINCIYQMVADGQSIRSVEAQLNHMDVWSPPPREKAKRLAGLPGNGWRTSYIKKLLHNEAVLGTYQPHTNAGGEKRKAIQDPVPNYYPPIIERELFNAVQVRLAKNKTNGGQTGKVCNVLRHLMRCAYCGGPMRFIDKGKPPKGAQYLECDNAARGVCCDRKHRVRYDEAERTVLAHCVGLKPEAILAQGDEHALIADGLKLKIDHLTQEISAAGQQLESLYEGLAKATHEAVRANIVTRLEQLESNKAQWHKEHEETFAKLRTHDASRSELAAWQGNLNTLIDGLPTATPAQRLKLNLHLKELIDQIEVFAVGYKQAYDPDSVPSVPANALIEPALAQPPGSKVVARKQQFAMRNADRIADQIYDIADAQTDPAVHAFAADTLARRMSKEGRFMRVHYKNGAIQQIVPSGSLAEGTVIRNDTCYFVGPDLGDLWAAFIKRRREPAKRVAVVVGSQASV